MPSCPRFKYNWTSLKGPTVIFSPKATLLKYNLVPRIFLWDPRYTRLIKVGDSTEIR
jgi:hypothetical protein